MCGPSPRRERLTVQEDWRIVIIVRIVTRVLCLVGFLAVALAAPAAQSGNAVGQISGTASIPGKGTLAGVTVQLRDLTTKQVVATAKTNASGQFVLFVDRAGSFIVEILD